MQMQSALARTQHEKAKPHTTLFVFFVSILLMFSACALPVRVKQASPEDVQRRMTGDVLTTGELSIPTENTLRRHALTERFEDAPEHALVELHAEAVRDDNPGDFFALSELSFY